jgi:hypothetical protein
MGVSGGVMAMIVLSRYGTRTWCRAVNQLVNISLSSNPIRLKIRVASSWDDNEWIQKRKLSRWVLLAELWQ